jgi:hypothetical protein
MLVLSHKLRHQLLLPCRCIAGEPLGEPLAWWGQLPLLDDGGMQHIIVCLILQRPHTTLSHCHLLAGAEGQRQG